MRFEKEKKFLGFPEIPVPQGDVPMQHVGKLETLLGAERAHISQQSNTLLQSVRLDFRRLSLSLIKTNFSDFSFQLGMNKMKSKCHHSKTRPRYFDQKYNFKQHYLFISSNDDVTDLQLCIVECSSKESSRAAVYHASTDLLSKSVESWKTAGSKTHNK